jgi:Zn-dependent protease
MNQLEFVGQLRMRLIDILPDAETLWNQATPPGPQERGARNTRPTLFSKAQNVGPAARSNTIAFRGHLAIDSDQAYALLRERFAELGYTPLLRHQDGYDVVVAIRHVFQTKPGTIRWIPNLILLLITICTTTLMGAVMEQSEQLMRNPALFFQKPWLILTGIPASLTIMSILGIHELAHYFVARKHRLDTTLPYFIPVPFGFGTFGAIIRIRTPWENRKALFDVGLAGPLAGFIIALPLFFIGLLSSPARPPIPGALPLGSPFLLQWVEKLVYLIRDIPKEHDIYVNAMTFAAWFGIIVTGFNLLPVGQLDGGHVAYAVLGRWTRILGIVVLIALVSLGILAWQGWFVWSAFILFSGWQHPAPLNTVAPLGKTRTILGVLTLAMLILLFTPAPFPM